MKPAQVIDVSKCEPVGVPALSPSCPSAVPGFEGWVTDLQKRIDAVGDGDVPLEWTPEHVGARLIEAYETLRLSCGHVGPKAFGNGWPEMMREFADLVDPDAQKNHAAERSSSRNRPSSETISRMNEALGWPRRFLDGEALKADALMVWTYAKALDLDMARLLHLRKKRAMALAEEMERRHNAPPHIHEGKIMDTRDPAVIAAAVERQRIASEVARITNDALAAAPKFKHAEIRRQAIDAFRARCRDAGCLPRTVTPKQAMPNRVMARSTLDYLRKQAMQIVATRLRRAGVAVR